MIDWSYALKMSGGDEALLSEVIDAFQQEAPTLMVDIRDAIRTRNTALLHRAAHTLKNSLMCLGAAESGETAFALEKLACDGQFDGAEALSAALESELALICEELKRR